MRVTHSLIDLNMIYVRYRSSIVTDKLLLIVIGTEDRRLNWRMQN